MKLHWRHPVGGMLVVLPCSNTFLSLNGVCFQCFLHLLVVHSKIVWMHAWMDPAWAQGLLGLTAAWPLTLTRMKHKKMRAWIDGINKHLRIRANRNTFKNTTVQRCGKKTTTIPKVTLWHMDPDLLLQILIKLIYLCLLKNMWRYIVASDATKTIYHIKNITNTQQINHFSAKKNMYVPETAHMLHTNMSVFCALFFFFFYNGRLNKIS